MGLTDFFDHEQAQRTLDAERGAHEAHLSHELVAGAAAFAAARAYNKHSEANGHPGSHSTAKELLAGLAGAEVDRLAETKGLDYLDRERAKGDARRHAENAYDQHVASGSDGNGFSNGNNDVSNGVNGTNGTNNGF